MSETPVWLVSDPVVHGGSPVVRGTRIPAATIRALLERGMAPTRIVELYPDVPLEAVSFLTGPSAAARRHADQVERTIVALRTCDPPARLQAIADALGVTRARVHQIFAATPEGRAEARRRSTARARAWEATA